MRLELALGMLLTVAAAEAAQLYRWVVENGVTHFSSKRPERGADGRPELEGGRVGKSPAHVSPQGDSKFFSGPQRLLHGGWQGCHSDLCALVKRLDPECATPMCSDAKRYSDECASLSCQTNRLVFERDVRERLARQESQRGSTPRAVSEPPRPPSKRSE